LKEKGEFQITNALENMQRKGLRFAPGKVAEWLDCGNKNATVETHGRWLQLNPHTNTTGAGLHSENAVVIQPCFIGNNVKLSHSVVGPNVSIADGTSISNSVVQNSIIQKNTSIRNSVIDNAMIGSHAEIHGAAQAFSLGDYSTMKHE
jgi:glucose-1-phosphate thymidylyltransferase